MKKPNGNGLRIDAAEGRSANGNGLRAAASVRNYVLTGLFAVSEAIWLVMRQILCIISYIQYYTVFPHRQTIK